MVLANAAIYMQTALSLTVAVFKLSRAALRKVLVNYLKIAGQRSHNHTAHLPLGKYL